MNIELLSAQTQVGFPLLTTIVVLPALGALAVAAIKDRIQAQRIAGAVSVGGLLLALVAAFLFSPGGNAIQMVDHLEWLPTMGISYTLGLDGLNVLFVPLTALLFLALVATAGDVKTDSRLYLVQLLLLESATLGVYTAMDLMLFFCFFELALIPTFWLIRVWGTGAQRKAVATHYLVYMLLGSLPLMVGFILLAVNHANVATTAGGTGSLSFDWVELMKTPVPAAAQTLIFALLAVGFAIKGPALPFHTWMPSALTEGPTSVGMYLVGLKLGAYGFMRFVLPLTPDASREYASIVIAVGLLAILYAGLIAITQFNLRRLIAFASISHFGLILVAIFSMNTVAWQGTLMLMVNAGLGTAGLLLVAGFLQRRLGSTDLVAMGGLVTKAPQLSAVCFIAGLALIGLPGTSGFAGELMAMTGAYKVHWAYGAIAALGVIVSAAYFLWFFQRGFMGPVKHAVVAKMSDLDGTERRVALGLVAVIFAVGFFPNPLLRATEGSVEQLTAHLQPRTGMAQVTQVPASAPSAEVSTAAPVTESTTPAASPETTPR